MVYKPLEASTGQSCVRCNLTVAKIVDTRPRARPVDTGEARCVRCSPKTAGSDQHDADDDEDDNRDETRRTLRRDDEEVARIHASSGTTGKPKIGSYTDDDLDTGVEVVARSRLRAALKRRPASRSKSGVRPRELAPRTEELGASVVPIGSGQTQRQVEVPPRKRCAPCTPSYALYLAETAEEMGHDPRDLPISTIIFGAEPCTEPMRNEIEERLGVTGIDIYGLSEIVGPGVSVECEAQDGLHIWEDYFYPEVVDPNTGDPVEEGEEGELVLTTLAKDALPVLRYRTGDLTTRTTTSVRAYGVSSTRHSGPAGPTSAARPGTESLSLRNRTAFGHRLRRSRGPDDPTMSTTPTREQLLGRTAEQGPLSDLEGRIQERLANVLSFTPDELHLVEYGDIARTEVGKVQRVYDHRD